MTSLKERVNQKSQEASNNEPKRNPEIDAKIDRYMKDHPERVEYLKTVPREHLERKAMLQDAMKYHARLERQSVEESAVQKFLKENPEIAEKIEQKIVNVPDEQKQKARLNLGRREATKTALKIT